MDLVEGFPEYRWGAKVIAAKVERLPIKRVKLTFVPTTLDLAWFERCDYVDETAPDASLEIEMKINNIKVGGGGCGGSVRPADWSAFGVRVGKPATITLTVTGASQFDQQKQHVVDVPVRGTGTIALALGERLSFKDYPLPARPATLKPLEQIGYGGADRGGTYAIECYPADPGRPVSLVVTWPGGLQYEAVSQTPGFLHIAVNGKDVADTEWWDYEQGSSGGWLNRDTEGMPRLKKGQRVTITVRPEHVTGAWTVHLWPDPPA
jgi:hypothetical protein